MMMITLNGPKFECSDEAMSEIVKSFALFFFRDLTFNPLEHIEPGTFKTLSRLEIL